MRPIFETYSGSLLRPRSSFARTLATAASNIYGRTLSTGSSDTLSRESRAAIPFSLVIQVVQDDRGLIFNLSAPSILHGSYLNSTGSGFWENVQLHFISARQDGQDLGGKRRRVLAHAQGLQQFRLLGSLLARLGPGRVSVVRQHGQDLGCTQRRVHPDAYCRQVSLSHLV